MNEAKHTPGPWIQNGVRVISGREGGLVEIADMMRTGLWDFRTPDRGTAMANARLCAAAPDLLAALQNLLQHANSYSDAMAEFGRGSTELGENADSVSITGMARAAIDKATGQA